ncbi:hypothetical protein SteCoe_25540 [Stentor coeruleus]|uniref:Uncharacterized protein n=1 Tax=Stentor coeruleus TaxID=5963 RepID=A0A1R2BF04_9CILI|nr:hypothetical protein SteCoe_25540 [Stentor coeruleus]
MGCCEVKEIQNLEVEERIRTCIETGNSESLKTLCKLITYKNKSFDVNTIRFRIDDKLIVNPLGLTVLVGDEKLFNIILQDMGGDFDLMESLFDEAQTTGLSIICLNNYLVLLQAYLPLFMNSKKQETSSKPQIKIRETLNLDAKEELEKIIPCTYTPMQLAVENGHVGIVNILKSYTCNLTLIPSEIDIDYIEEITGNNSALISCKCNNYKMIKFLHCQCNADFNIINNFSENAINVLAIGSKENRAETFNCLEYLIEKVGVDFLYNYQETLILLKEPRAVCYFEQKLYSKGIVVNKLELEAEAIVRPAKRTACAKYETGNRFTFTRMFPELIRNSREGFDNILDIDN